MWRAHSGHALRPRSRSTLRTLGVHSRGHAHRRVVVELGFAVCTFELVVSLTCPIRLNPPAMKTQQQRRARVAAAACTSQRQQRRQQRAVASGTAAALEALEKPRAQVPDSKFQQQFGDPASPEPVRSTLLHIVSAAGFWDCVKLLLEMQAKVRIPPRIAQPELGVSELSMDFCVGSRIRKRP